MSVMPRRERPLHPFLVRLFRLAALLVWVGQVGLAVAPVVEARGATNVGVHVEGDANPLHHAHNPDLCPACAALALVGRPESARPLFAARAAETAAPAGTTTCGPSAACPLLVRPRAPPVGLSEFRLLASHDFDTLTIPIHAFGNLAVRADPGRRDHRGRPTAAAA